MTIELTEQKYHKPSESEPDDPFDASPNLPGQVKSREAYGRLEAVAKDTPWWADYQTLRNERDGNGKQLWNWREAVYIAWASLPKQKRWPTSHDDLATQILGITDARTIRQWRYKRPEMDDRIARLTGDSLMRHRAEVLDALVQVASQPDPRSYSDRRLFLEMTGDYKPRQGLEHSGPEGGPIKTEVEATIDPGDELAEFIRALAETGLITEAEANPVHPALPDA